MKKCQDFGAYGSFSSHIMVPCGMFGNTGAAADRLHVPSSARTAAFAEGLPQKQSVCIHWRRPVKRETGWLTCAGRHLSLRTAWKMGGGLMCGESECTSGIFTRADLHSLFSIFCRSAGQPYRTITVPSSTTAGDPATRPRSSSRIACTWNVTLAALCGAAVTLVNSLSTRAVRS